MLSFCSYLQIVITSLLTPLLYVRLLKKKEKKKKEVSRGTALNGNKEMCLNPLGCLGCLK